MGPVQLPPEAQEVVRSPKGKIQSAPVLEMDASKEGLGAVLSQKQDDGCYHPVTFGSHSLTPVEKNYHSLKLEVECNGALQGIFGICTFFVKTDNNPLTYVLTTPNLDTTAHRWVGALASFEFILEYKKGVENGAANTLSQAPISHDHVTVRSLLEGTVIGAADCSEANTNKALLHKHVCLVEEARVQATRLVPMHVVNWEDAQGTDMVLAACRKWLKAHKDTPAKSRDALLKKYLGNQTDTEEDRALFHIHNSLVLSKGLLYISTMPKGELEGVLPS